MPTSEQHPDTNAGEAEDVAPSGQPAVHDEKRREPAVVGIGASAGGLAALKQFFRGVPEESGLVFVVVMHFSPEHESHLADLLQPHTPMPVQQVTETTRLEADRVYVIPPGRNLNAIDTHLRLSSLEEGRRERAPIDHFFRTLAASHDGHAIGVILTGTGSDGTLGLKEIKMKGGLAVVQAPAEAEYDGMPQSAIVTGLVDLVLPLAEMPAEIIRFAHTEPRITMPEDGDEVGAREEERPLQKIFAQLVVFAPHNLLGDPPFSKIDLIACRNVLIYLQREVPRDVVELFHYALRPDGHLVLGTAETVEGADLFRVESKKHCVYRRRNVPPREPHLPVFSGREEASAAPARGARRAGRCITGGSTRRWWSSTRRPACS